MEKVFKTFKGEVKAVDEKERIVEVIVSTESKDRDSERILLSSFKKRLGTYKAHPILLSSHRYDSLQNQIGEAVSVKVTDDGLRAKFKYYTGEGNAEADWGFNLATKGIAGYSIGFMAHQFEDSTKEEFEKTGIWRTFTDIELFEISQVLIPSNRDAVQERQGKAEGIEREMCELAIKSIFPAEIKAEDTTTTEQNTTIENVKQENIEAVITEVKETGVSEERVKELIAEFVKSDEFVGIVKSITTEKQDKHYSELLFKSSKEDENGEVDIESDELSPLIDMIRSTIKDSLKGVVK
jgi:HK97 family phage prohead protease